MWSTDNLSLTLQGCLQIAQPPNCNVALGLLKEDENIIWNLLDYLKEDGIIKQKTLNDIFHVKE